MDKLNIDQIKTGLSQIKRQLPGLLAKDAQQFFTDEFRKTQQGQPQQAAPRKAGGKYQKKQKSGRRDKATAERAQQLQQTELITKATTSYSGNGFSVEIRPDDSASASASKKGAKAGITELPGNDAQLRTILTNTVTTQLDKAFKS